MATLLSMSFLCMQLVLEGAAGISTRSLALHMLGIVARLYSTAQSEGYTPADWTGDWLYQAVDALGLLLATVLFISVMWCRTLVPGDSCMALLSTIPATLAAMGLAALVHADMAGDPARDTLWLTGLLLQGFAGLPQFWLAARTKGVTLAFVEHSIATGVLSQMFNGIYVWHARKSVITRVWFKEVNVSAFVMLISFLPSLVLVPDYSLRCTA